MRVFSKLPRDPTFLSALPGNRQTAKYAVGPLATTTAMKYPFDNSRRETCFLQQVSKTRLVMEQCTEKYTPLLSAGNTDSFVGFSGRNPYGPILTIWLFHTARLWNDAVVVS